MTHLFSDEFISAWLDDELDEAEAAEIQAAVESDPILARRVNELRLLSGIFKSLPVEPVPRGFKDLVVEATRTAVRDTTPVSASSTLPADRSSHAPKRNAQRSWLGVVGLLSTAALVLVTINLTGGPGGFESDADALKVASTNAPMTTRANEEFTFADAAGSAMPHESFDDAAEFGDSPSVEAELPPVIDVSQLTFEDELKDADVGDVIEAIRQTDSEMTVVKLTVVDITESANKLEVLLAAHGSAQLRPGGMVMVEAGRQELAACFRKLQREDLYEQMMFASRKMDSREYARGLPGSIGEPMEQATKAAGAAAETDSREKYGSKSTPAKRGRNSADDSTDSGKPGISQEVADEADSAPKAQNKPTDGKKPIRLLIVLEPSPEKKPNEGNGSILDFRWLYGPVG